MDIHRDEQSLRSVHVGSPDIGNLWQGSGPMKRPLLLLCSILCMLAAFGVTSVGQPAADMGYCKVSPLPLDAHNSLSSLRLSKTSFFGITREYSTASIELVNLSSLSIESVAMIIEYRDASNKVVQRIPF